MKIVRFKSSYGHRGIGILAGGEVREIEGDIFGTYRLLPNTYSEESVAILPPCTPTKIVGVGLNYKDHAEEMKKPIPDEPLIFLKPPTSVIGHGDAIIYPDHMSSRVDYEGELAVVIGKRAKWIREADWKEYVLGYTCINDVTARDLQAKDVQFTRAKGFDTFAPLGPSIETDLDPSDLEIKTTVGGRLRQHSRTSQMIFPVPRLIAFISRVMTLLPGDIIATGTPAGIGPMKRGDTVEVEIEGIGVLRNRVE
jgi:2-keto-4-pentenoate hydratase/2-oxohepta-3-ene-1,7-dioic acid hydratase in catechol pathway